MSDQPILILEDEMLIAMAMADELGDEGHATMIACSIDQAVEALQSNAFKLAIVDFNIDGTPSTKVVETLSAQAIPFIVCTGSQMDEMASAIGEAARLSKPYASADLVTAVSRALAPAALPGRR